MAIIVDKQLQSLLDGFDALRVEYQRLWSRCAALESNIAAARSEHARRAEPLNPSPVAAPNTAVDFEGLISSSKIVDAQHRDKITAASRTSTQLRSLPDRVVIHAGPSADRPSAPTSSAMPSISESPLEQDFTVPGTPSKLGCPFASMANRRLSSHAASVVSRYKPDHVPSPAPRSATSRPAGRASSSARASIVDPMKAEVCAMDSPTKPRPPEASVQGSSTGAGVCPIRFLDRHSPEEVAAYFESHKHELPRSHELCVKRYQTNEEQIRQLDAKYGNIVSMIQGLGQKHVPMLPEKLADDDDDDDEHDGVDDEERASNEKIRQWASTVADGPEDDSEDGEDEEERLPHFDRPMKDVRLGESPSRPWGIQVPLQAQARRNSDASSASPVATPSDSKPQPQVEPQAEQPRGRCPFSQHTPKPDADPVEAEPPVEEVKPRPQARCPFSFGATVNPHAEDVKSKAENGETKAEPPLIGDAKADEALPREEKTVGPEAKAREEKTVGSEAKAREEKTLRPKPQEEETANARAKPQGESARNAEPVFVQVGTGEQTQQGITHQPQMVFTGPVFFGLSVEQAISVLQARN